MFFFLLGVIVSIIIYQKLIRPCHYWRDRGIKYARGFPLVGSMGKVMLKKEPFVDVAFNLYNKYPEERFVGYMVFTQQCLLIRDIDLIKQIAVKDFNHFTDHAFFGQGSDADPLLNKSLVSLSGEKWKEMRNTLSPVFTSSKMKNMYHLMDECAEEFVNHFKEETELEMKDIFSKFASNVIASTAFGITIDCLKEPNNEFFHLGVLLSDFTFWQTVKLILVQSSKSIANAFQIEIFPHRATKFFRTLIKDNIEKREAEGIVRQDLIHLLMEARKGQLKPESSKSGKNEGFAAAEETEIDPSIKQIELTDEYIVAQAMLFFFAGFDTVSTTASFMAHELAVNPDVQKKLHEEIDGVKRKHGDKIPYEALLSMKYLDQVVSETLRMWPAGFETDRVCVNDYLIEPKTPEEKDLMVRKGVIALFPIMAIQRDPQYYSEPDRFDPERFNDENKSKIIPGTYMPFGWGPRNCIGSRFALLEVKNLFCHLLSKFEIVPIERTQIPIKISAKYFNLRPESGFWLGFKPRSS